VAATHQNLKDLVQGGRFRQDLLFRLEVVHLHSPSLRDRKEDIPELASYFLKEHSQRHDKKLNHLSKEAMKIMTRYSWPGNIRELSNVIERAIVFCDSNHFELSATYLPEHLKNYVEVSGADGSISVKIGTTLKDVEDLLIRKTLEATDGDRNLTAQILGVNSRTIYRKLQNT
jgi:two-component system response regulator HydG